MRGIRWIVGFPLGYFSYVGIIELNLLIIRFAIRLIPSETFWAIESLLVNTFLAIYIALTITYLFLPQDQYALINNIKVKFIYWILSAWSVVQLLLLGAGVWSAFNDYNGGALYQVFYPILTLMAIWMTFSGIKLVDFRHNQPTRDYFEAQYQLEQSGVVIETD